MVTLIGSKWVDGELAFFNSSDGVEIMRLKSDGTVDFTADIIATNGGSQSYYVDGNAGLDTNDGLSWSNPFKTLAVAMAASHANISASSKGWAARNRIYFKADGSEEDLTKFAQKTDIIGIGSTDWKAKPAIYGNHVVPSTTSYMGCRFFNILFRGDATTGGDIITMTQHGIEFIGCEFLATGSGTDATAAIVSTAGVGLKVDNCIFKGEFGDSVIEIGAGQADDLIITNNLIQGANLGVEVLSTATFVAGKFGLIKDNVFSTTLACISDSSDEVYVVGNRGATLAAKGSALAGAVVCNIKLALDNRFTTSDADNVVYPANGTI